MGTPFLAEIKLLSFGFAPRGWALCNGQTLPINQNQALFSLLGTTYGGNGQTTFNLPNLQGRTPIHVGSGHVLGETGGEQAHTLIQSELPQHTHTVNGSGVPADTNTPTTSTLLGQVANTYTAAANTVALNPAEITTVGGGQSHLNMQPYLTINFSIALQGIFPSPN